MFINLRQCNALWLAIYSTNTVFLFQFSPDFFLIIYIGFMLILENLWTREECALGRERKVHHNPTLERESSLHSPRQPPHDP